MNLVAKEFVAARDDERGVLVLSHFTGAARELTEALIVNPYDLDEASAALAAALDMPAEEQRDRMRAMRALRRRVQRLPLGRAHAGRRGAPAAARAAHRRGCSRPAARTRSDAGRDEAPPRRAPTATCSSSSPGSSDAAGLRLRRDARADRARAGRGGDAPVHAAPAPARWPGAYPCVVISGRSRADVAAAGPRSAASRGRRQPRRRARARHRRRALRACADGCRSCERRLGRIQGVVIEDKGLSLAVHYRRSRQKKTRAGRGSSRRRACLGEVSVLGGQAGGEHPARGGAPQGTGPRAGAGAPGLRHGRLRGRRRDRRGRVRARPAGRLLDGPRGPQAEAPRPPTTSAPRPRSTACSGCLRACRPGSKRRSS